MKILIICQKLAEDDDLLGAFVAWVRAISKNVDHVDVVCLSKGKYNLPNNCEIYSLGKERGVGRIGRWIKFVRLMFKLMPKCEATFSHMSPIFSIVSWPFVKLYRKKATLWYAHGHVGWKIKLAEKCVDIIFTSTPEGCRTASDKIRVVGQGIDINKFIPEETKKQRNKETKGGANYDPSDPSTQLGAGELLVANDKFQMVSIGRIAPSKDYETMIKAVEVLVRDGMIDFEIKVIGRANLTEHNKYFEKIKKMASEDSFYKPIIFHPAVFRDISITVPQGTKIAEVLNVINASSSEILKDVDLFDVYSGEEIGSGRENLSFHIIYQDENKTLSSKEVDQEHQKIIKALEENLEWEVRK